jgi:hypothetical protein
VTVPVVMDPLFNRVAAKLPLPVTTSDAPERMHRGVASIDTVREKDSIAELSRQLGEAEIELEAKIDQSALKFALDYRVEL